VDVPIEASPSGVELARGRGGRRLVGRGRAAGGREAAAAPSRLSTLIVPRCMSTIERTIARPRPLPAAARLVGRGAAIEPVEDLRQLVALDADARVGDVDPGRRRRRARRGRRPAARSA
jgi:hypothetical protein